jgi:hypothetical protein
VLEPRKKAMMQSMAPHIKTRIALSIAGLAMVPSTVRAEENQVHPPNRLWGSLGLGVEFHNQGEFSAFCNGCFAFLTRFAYLRKLVRGFEVGGSFGYRHDVSPESTVQAVFPTIAIRPYLDNEVEGQLEIGLLLQAFAQVTWTPEVPGIWTGIGYTAGPDIRVWVEKTVAFDLCPEVTPNFTSHNPNSSEFIAFGTPRDPTFATLTIWLGALGAF